MPPLLIYIHGFLSSPGSEKATETRAYLEARQRPVEFICPGLSDYPGEAFQQLQALIVQNTQRQIALIGSSLGGYMATALAEQYRLRAVLVNPGVRPYTLINDYRGVQQNPYTGNRFEIRDQDIDALKQMEVATIARPWQLKVLLQTGDETLDYRLAVDYYRDCQQVIESGGDHRFQRYQLHLPDILEFLQLP